MTNPRGRPKKVIAEPVPNNPDQKLATRGYVKCIARKIQSHQHVNNMSEGIGWSVISLLVMGLAMFAVTLILWDTHMPLVYLLLITVGWSVVANSLLLIIILWVIDHDTTTRPDEKPEEIAAYVPPSERKGTFCGEDY